MYMFVHMYKGLYGRELIYLVRVDLARFGDF